MKWMTVTIVGLLGAGCATLQPVERMPFPEDEYNALPTTGTGTVAGQAFLKTVGGDVKTAAGNTVILNPVTSYSEQAYAAFSAGRQLDPVEPDTRLYKYARTTTADGEGRFEFSNVPPGEYFIATSVVWQAPVGYRGTMRVQGGLVFKRVRVGDGEAVKVIITR